MVVLRAACKSSFVADTDAKELTERASPKGRTARSRLATSRIWATSCSPRGKSEKAENWIQGRRAPPLEQHPPYFAADIAYHRNKLEVRGL